MDPITIAALGIGGIGSVAGMFRKTPKASVPTMDSLRRQNPDLYNSLLGMQRQAKAFEQMAAQRQGVTAAQQQAVNDNQSQVNQQLANRGLVGSSAGTQMATDGRTRAMNQMLEQAMRERMALMQASGQAEQGFLSGFNQAVAPQMQAHQMNMQNQIADQQGMNQFFSGLMNGGMQMYGTEQYLASTAEQGALNRDHATKLAGMYSGGQTGPYGGMPPPIDWRLMSGGQKR